MQCHIYSMVHPLHFRNIGKLQLIISFPMHLASYSLLWYLPSELWSTYSLASMLSFIYCANLMCRSCELMFCTGKLTSSRQDLVACQRSCPMGLKTCTTTGFQSWSIQVWLRYVLCSVQRHSTHSCMLVCTLWMVLSTLQICSHTGPTVDPDKRDLDLGSPSIPDVATFIQNHFKGIELKPSIVEYCMYTVSVTSCTLVAHCCTKDTTPTNPCNVVALHHQLDGGKTACCGLS